MKRYCVYYRFTQLRSDIKLGLDREINPIKALFPNFNIEIGYYGEHNRFICIEITEEELLILKMKYVVELLHDIQNDFTIVYLNENTYELNTNPELINSLRPSINQFGKQMNLHNLFITHSGVSDHYRDLFNSYQIIYSQYNIFELTDDNGMFICAEITEEELVYLKLKHDVGEYKMTCGPIIYYISCLDINGNHIHGVDVLHKLRRDL